jgi:thioredoxin reductase
MGAGALEALAKSGLPMEGRQVVVAGTGPLLLTVAKYLRGHGASVRLVAEQTDHSTLYRFVRGLARHPGKLAQAVFLRAGLLGIPYLTGCWPVAAEGRGKLESVTLCRGGKTWSEPCDYLACGFGLVPNVELAALLGCRMSEAGVGVDEYQRTSVAGVYCAGEATGIGGLDLSLAEGQIAGYAAAGRPESARKLFRARQSHGRFAAALNETFALRGELRSFLQDQTVRR